ncbi:MAG: hypothetical protein RBT66_02725, partial [bacterium]|nr:hypothetical protein [bacterium]
RGIYGVWGDFLMKNCVDWVNCIESNILSQIIWVNCFGANKLTQIKSPEARINSAVLFRCFFFL